MGSSVPVEILALSWGLESSLVFREQAGQGIKNTYIHEKLNELLTGWTLNL